MRGSVPIENDPGLGHEDVTGLQDPAFLRSMFPVNNVGKSGRLKGSQKPLGTLEPSGRLPEANREAIEFLLHTYCE